MSKAETRLLLSHKQTNTGNNNKTYPVNTTWGNKRKVVKTPEKERCRTWHRCTYSWHDAYHRDSSSTAGIYYTHVASTTATRCTHHRDSSSTAGIYYTHVALTTATRCTYHRDSSSTAGIYYTHVALTTATRCTYRATTAALLQECTTHAASTTATRCTHRRDGGTTAGIYHTHGIDYCILSLTSFSQLTWVSHKVTSKPLKTAAVVPLQAGCLSALTAPVIYTRTYSLWHIRYIIQQQSAEIYISTIYTTFLSIIN